MMAIEQQPIRQRARMISLTIESLAYGGGAIARLGDGRTAFVSGAVPGDTVLAEIVEEHERFVRVRTVEVVSAAADRVAAPCPYFGVCGGCTWQHVAYPAQLHAKRRAVVDALQRIGHLADAESLVAETIPSPSEYGYRNKVEFVLDTSRGRTLLGLHKAASDEIIGIDECLLLPKASRKAPKALRGALAYVTGNRDLGLNRVALRVGAHTRDVEVALWGVPGPFPRKAVATTLGSAIKMTSLVRVMTDAPSKERRIAGVEVLSGKGHWRERLLGTTFAISAPSFFQINTKAAEKLVELVIEALSPDGSDRILDLYAGAGTFTLPLAEKAGEVVAIESAGSAVRDLRRNLELEGLYADVIGGDALRELSGLGRVDSTVVDPPRSGLRAQTAQALAATRARTIAYVSCDPSTLARDSAALASCGYTLVSATPVDLFPQTYHIETVATFMRSDT
jgi:23S rRNA (uracil1939-C5)-methyltransferase